ncbi:copper ion binding protein [Neobacillus niacini]|uniref:copper ion binding protein n=1 Tax=Neobacillus niacini TaxID=86668 RepID=UPI0021CAE849|nr:copper ion binding protein [Neobacillus niacini]MCM3764413.1 copper ion binding protein [Neobacillus niacini]
MVQVTLAVNGMSCMHCVMAIKSSVGKLTGVKEVKVNLKEANVTVTFNADQVALNQIKDRIESKGYVVCH